MAEPADSSANRDCVFCREVGGEVLFDDDVCRVVLVGGEEGAAFPGFCRIVSNQHAREMSDLPSSAQHHIFAVVMAAERAVRAVQRPYKVNLASLGNLVPHVHWHVIPRWQDDSHFPGPIWAAPQRSGVKREGVDGGVLRRRLDREIRSASA